MRLPRAQFGVGLVELLVVLGITGAILGVVGAFFAFQAGVSRDTQLRNSLNIGARTVLEAVAQDLKMAGARAVFDEQDNLVDFRNVLPCEPDPDDDEGVWTCLIVDDGVDGNLVLEIEYLSSLFLDDGLGEVCRRVVYRLDASSGTVYRIDVRCDAPLDELPTFDGFESEFAQDIELMAVEFVCGPGGGDDETVPIPVSGSDPARCFRDGYEFVREGRLTVVAERNGRSVELSTATSMPNLRDPFRYAQGEVFHDD